MSQRKVKDAKDLENDELIYFKGHAKATFMSDGRTVEDAINDVGNGDWVTTETDPIFSASAAAKITDGNISAWNDKQDRITDLEAIRSGAAKGATALQVEQYTGTYSKPSGGIPKTDLASTIQESLSKADTAIQTHQDISGKADKSSLAAVATSGSYNDLHDKPTIPSAVTESTVSGWGFTKNTGTVTGVKMNGTSKGTSGVVDLGNVITGDGTILQIVKVSALPSSPVSTTLYIIPE